MFGSGLLKGLGVTLKHFADTFTDDRQKVPSRYRTAGTWATAAASSNSRSRRKACLRFSIRRRSACCRSASATFRC